MIFTSFIRLLFIIIINEAQNLKFCVNFSAERNPKSLIRLSSTNNQCDISD